MTSKKRSKKKADRRAYQRAYYLKHRDRMILAKRKEQHRGQRESEECRRERRRAKKRAYYWKNRDKMRARARAWYRKNRETVIAKVKEWEKDNPERLRKRRRAYYLANLARIKAYHRQYHQRNKARRKQSLRAYLERPGVREKQRTKFRAYYEKHKDRYLERARLQRLKKRLRTIRDLLPLALMEARKVLPSEHDDPRYDPQLDELGHLDDMTDAELYGMTASELKRMVSGVDLDTAWEIVGDERRLLMMCPKVRAACLGKIGAAKRKRAGGGQIRRRKPRKVCLSAMYW